MGLMYNVGVSIREFGGKIKDLSQDLSRDLLQSNRFFYGATGVLIALISFGAGRLSVTATPGVLAPAVQKVDSRASTLEATVPEDRGLMPVQGREQGEGSATETEVGAKGGSASSAPALPEKVYVGSKNSTKYHLPWCAGAKRIAEANQVWFASKEEAHQAGYTPAANCPGI